MKQIYIYNPYWSTMGGGEKYVLILAEILSSLVGTCVAILSDQPGISKADLERFSNVDLSGIEYRIIHDSNEVKNITTNSEIFICQSNYRVIKANSSKFVQLLQVPYGTIRPKYIMNKILHGHMQEGVKDVYRLKLYANSRNNADLVITNSKFVAETLQKNHGIKSQVLYPPIQDFQLAGTEKRNIILSVGRFFRGLYNDKRYDILTEAFRQASSGALKGWEYHIAGSAASDHETQGMLRLLKEANRDFPIHFHINEPYASLQRLYNEASIFWHAAGYGIDETKTPEKVEHFGMTTVEAMSASCIPVVIERGGQREIVTHGKNGYMWDTLENLIFWTINIVNKRISIEKFREEARNRSLYFGLPGFRKRVVEIFEPLISH